MSDQHEHHHEAGGHEHGHHGSGTALTLISLAHGINHAQSAFQPLVYPLVLVQLGFGYAELGIMLGVASAVADRCNSSPAALADSLSVLYCLGSAMRLWEFASSSSPSHKAFRNSSLDGHVTRSAALPNIL